MKSVIRIKDFAAALNIAFIVLIAVLLVGASSVAILVYEGTMSESSPIIVKAKWGDKVRVDYIGRFADGRVFDTSVWDVASNDAMYPKSLSFTLRNQSTYKPLEFKIGSGQMIPGFERGIIGMAINETRVISVSPRLGYGETDVSKLVTKALVEELPVFEQYNLSSFIAKFSETPRTGLTITHPFWGWDVICLEVNTQTGMVRVMNNPVAGAHYLVYYDSKSSTPTGWNVRVELIDSSANGGTGLIKVRNLLTEADSGMVKGIDINGNQFYVDRVDETSGTMILNYNPEVVGKTLYFTVTLLAVL